MIKSELSQKISVDTGINKALALLIINSTMKIIVEAVSKGGIVQVVGFGTFIAKKRVGRSVTIPLTDKKVKIPTTKAIKFIAGKRFAESINKKKN